MKHDKTPDRSAALAAWRLMLGSDRVLDADQAQSRWGADTSGLTRPIGGGVRPRSADEVAGVVRVAHEFGVDLHPISTGHNWGYGTALPPEDHQVILDLSDLRRIVDFDAELGVVTVEPGVTQGMLHEFLTAGGHPYMVPTTGAGPDCSLMGNALQRGYGITPICDHWSAVTDLEAVRWDGSRYQSPLARAGAPELSRLHRWGLGPYENGLFSQGRAGVVTRMSMLLANRPEVVRLAVFNLRDDQHLGEVIPLVHQTLITLPGVIGGINLMNQLRVLAMTIPYPEEFKFANTHLPIDLISKLGLRHRISPWTGIITLYGTSEVVSVATQVIKAIMRSCNVKPLFLSSRMAGWGEKLTQLIPGSWGAQINNRARTLAGAIELASGRPNRTALPLAYWKSKKKFDPKKTHNPAKDGCGLLWYAPLVPMKSRLVLDTVNFITGTMRAYNFDPLITFTSISSGLFDATTPILFDSSNKTHALQAVAVKHQLASQGSAIGLLPYRHGTLGWSQVD